MYNILILKRDSDIEPLYTPYRVKSEDGLTWVKFESDDEVIIEKTIEDLSFAIPHKNIWLVQDMKYITDVILGDGL